MLGDDALPHLAIMAILAGVLAVALPIAVVRRTARPEHLRERILLSRPGRVEAQCIVSIAVQSAAAVAFALLATVHPILWGVVALSVGPIVATALYLHRFRRALGAFAAEVVEATHAEHESPGRA